MNVSSTINYGTINESVVAQELKVHDFEIYYKSDKKRRKIDFLIEYDNCVIPIEVKSVKDYKKHSALTQLINSKEFNYNKAYVLYNNNFELKDKIIYLPI